jgi:hypothetical protein
VGDAVGEGVGEGDREGAGLASWMQELAALDCARALAKAWPAP